MLRVCEKCSETYNDFDRFTTCPHPRFEVSESALRHLVDQGVLCKRCERHIDECSCKK